MSKVTLNENRIGAVVRDAARDESARKLNAGADIWRSLARKDTGFMANAVNTVITVDRHGNPEGHLEFEAHYAPYQEYGFRHYLSGEWVEGQHIMHDVLKAMGQA